MEKRDKKILFLVFTVKAKDELIDKVLEFAERIGARIIALNVVDFSMIRHLSQKLEKREAEVSVDLEEEGWMYLYYVEERAKDRGIMINIVQEEGVVERELIKASEKFAVDLVVISREEHQGIANFNKFIESLLLRVKCPLLIL